jgi:hypothetical protein
VIAWGRASRSPPRGALALGVAAALAAIVGPWLSPPRAAAQEAVWLVSPAQRAAPWYEAARALLQSEGVTVHDADACDPLACVAEQARALGAQVALSVRVEPAAARASVTLLTPSGTRGAASRVVERGDVAAALRDAYRGAELALELGDDGLLRVATTPEGALVWIDGRVAGAGPLARRVKPGPHAISVSQDGFATRAMRVEVARGAATDLRVRLARSAPSSRPAQRERSALNYLLGGALLLGAVPMLASSLSTLALNGECAVKRDASGRCAEVVHFGAISGVLLGAGSAALVGGVYLLVAAPFTVQAQAARGALRLTMRARF